MTTRLASKAVTRLARDVQLVIFDVDGVLTDGSLFFDDHGGQYKAFNVRDGHGMRMLADAGVRIGVITGRNSGVVEHRMRDLGVELVMQGHRDKLPAFHTMLAGTGLETAQVAYVGDDVVDLPVMRRVGLPIAVADAHPLVLSHAHWVTHAAGGHGAVREVCEMILLAQDRLDAALAPYLR
ncbi:MAG: 3-deoxy-manno-octulosonate-8-phosphatase KdsC [Chromatiales bacterium]|jgi:3-deoxy-D-manno-octulosonate 8-phosphate phosphatase (KDO 8-P phosphatase)|nr:3-deoxy-manno-octulosonate-8-phosphatase KdsC [Chromatiales bacterium]MDX9766401.1 3-deoxy-manno-octulosonate-8-phosphatase KdsC [Ectothiorhodospiraceae bacterium]